MSPIRVALVALTALALVVVATPSYAVDRATQTVRIYHQAVNPIAVVGSGVGTVRTFFIPMAVDGVPADNQYLTGTLTTFAENVTGDLELRGSNLTFVFGDEADQIVVGGISLYPPATATLAPGTRTVRPILGGSGIYFGARGEVISTNLGPNGWTHVLRIRLT
jgi:hypothetical protein